MNPPVPVWATVQAEGCVLRLYVQPGAKRTEWVGLHGDWLKVRLAAPPVEGLANAALLALLAQTLGLRRNQVQLTHGDTSRQKTLWVQSPQPQRIPEVLNALIKEPGHD